MKRIFNPDTKDYDVVPSEGYGPNKMLVSDADGNPRWEERLAYKQVTESIFVAEQTVNTVKAPYGSSISGSGVCNGDIVYDKTYRVTFNGVDYTCVAHAGMNSMNFLGDSALSAANVSDESDEFSNGEPFAVRTDSGTFYLYTESADEYTVTISEVEEEIVPIPAEYLPHIVVKLDTGGMTATCNVPFDVFVSYVKTGAPMTFVIGSSRSYGAVCCEPNDDETVWTIRAITGLNSFTFKVLYSASGLTVDAGMPPS